MPRTEEQNQALRAATRERVTRSALRLFASHGYAATSVRDIAREAGLSTGVLYRHYPTKEALFAELVAQGAEGLRHAARAFDTASSPEEAIREFTEGMLTDLRSDAGFGEFFQLMNQAFTLPDPPDEVRELIRQHIALVGAIERLVARGQRAGCFRDGDPKELATCYFAAVGGLAALPRNAAFTLPTADVLVGFLTGDDR
ncbi:DNA-binding transcriptional regulator, AcrR family [Nocardiopsis flavescens]|uniref:DNA-binding transcriptional regulator, AcrR family n=1 Tax=Nocardiopsis flavescens TaxID=758803 RepID=A0A1M6D0Z0_9ACTN|nr:TetR/AcrR family transcriptional regulator [Nocardiopsis flavescens]SHI66952.1 DNA-binding transcriptional regulator, AcrR family [Nocardiopsis flavescens]